MAEAYLTPKQMVEKYPEFFKSESALGMKRMRKVGLPYSRLGKRIFYRESDIAAQLEYNRVLTADSVSQDAGAQLR